MTTAQDLKSHDKIIIRVDCYHEHWRARININSIKHDGSIINLLASTIQELITRLTQLMAAFGYIPAEAMSQLPFLMSCRDLAELLDGEYMVTGGSQYIRVVFPS